MDPRDHPTILLAPSASDGTPMSLPAAERSTTRPPPRIDERLARPETREEVLHGKLLYAAPADPAHATAHCRLGALLAAHVAPGYIAAVDMLTRTSVESDIAPDASVYPAAPDPSGHRQLEVMAFEIASEQSLSVAGAKVRELSRRGVRRVFCLLLKKGRLLEWSGETQDWGLLGAEEEIRDACLALPLPVGALLRTAELDDALARALLARQTPVLEARLEEERRQGREEGLERGREEGLERGREEGLENERRGLLDMARALLGEAAVAGLADVADVAELREQLTARLAQR